MRAPGRACRHLRAPGGGGRLGGHCALPPAGRVSVGPVRQHPAPAPRVAGASVPSSSTPGRARTLTLLAKAYFSHG